MLKMVIDDDTHDTHGIIYVLDSADEEHLAESQEFLKLLIQTRFVKDKHKPILILGNKQDLKQAKTEREIYEMMNLGELYGQHLTDTAENLMQLHITSEKFKSLDRGVKSGLKWLVGKIQENFEVIVSHLEEDVKIFKSEAVATLEKRRAEKLKRQKEAENQENSKSRLPPLPPSGSNKTMSKKDLEIKTSQINSIMHKYSESSDVLDYFQKGVKDTSENLSNGDSAASSQIFSPIRHPLTFKSGKITPNGGSRQGYRAGGDTSPNLGFEDDEQVLVRA